MRLILFVTICFVMCSCTKKTLLEEISAISIDGVSGEKKWCDLFDSIDYIPLETSDECIFGMIHKLIIYKNQFYILDKTHTRKIYVFNYDGTFSHSIGTIGSGPGEYINMEDFTIDEQKEQIVALTYPSTVYVYELGGDFVYSKKISESLLWNITSYKDGFICSTNHQTYTNGDNAYLLFTFDNDFKQKDKLLPVLPRQIGIPPFITNPLSHLNDKIIYFDNFANNVYFISTNELEKIESIHFNSDFEVPSEVWADNQLFFNKQNEYSFMLESFFENNKIWSFFSRKGKLCVLIANVDTGENVISYFTDWFPKILYQDDGFIYTSTNISHILENKSNLFPPVNFAFEEDSNPIILRFKTKL